MPSITGQSRAVAATVAQRPRPQLSLTLAQAARPQLTHQVTRVRKEVNIHLDGPPSEDVDFVLLYQTAKLLGG